MTQMAYIRSTVVKLVLIRFYKKELKFIKIIYITCLYMNILKCIILRDLNIKYIRTYLLFLKSILVLCSIKRGNTKHC